MKSPFLRTNDVSASGVESPTLADKDTLNMSNPVALCPVGQGLNKAAHRFFGSIGFNYEINKKISLSANGGVIYNKVRENFFIPRKGVTPDSLTTAIVYSRLGHRLHHCFFVHRCPCRLPATINKVHAITARAGATLSQGRPERTMAGYNSPIDELVSVGNGVNGLRKIGGEIGESKWFDVYANAEYAYKDKYFISVNAAGDASSRFGKMCRML